MEAEVQANLPGRFSVEVAGHLIRGEAKGDGAFLDDIPPTTLTLRVRRDFSRGFVWVRTALYDRLDRPGPSEQERAGYGLLDAAAGVRVGKKVEVNVVGRNLLDQAHLVSPDSRAVLAPGISGIVTLIARF